MLGIARQDLSPELKAAFAAELDRLLRVRLRWLAFATATVVLLWMLYVVIVGLSGVRDEPLKLVPVPWNAWTFRISMGILAAVGAIGGVVFRLAGAGVMRATPMRWVSYAYVLLTGAGLAMAVQFAGGKTPWNAGAVWIFMVVLVLFLPTAWSLMPWTGRQVLVPMTVIAAPMLVALGIMIAAGGHRAMNEMLPMLVGTFFSMLFFGLLFFGMPVTMTARRLEKFKTMFYQGRYGRVSRELVDARRIHEDLFPGPIADGPLRFDYRYLPMQQIGGDYVFARRADGAAGQPGMLSVVLVDVTGHGVAAALTVNRLHGELERAFNEDPTIGPGDVLRTLNHYINLTLANHSMFVTAICMRADLARGVLEYANAGHPPAFLRRASGGVEQIDPTAVLLGVEAKAQFDPAPVSVPFGEGDALIAYTDGASEAQDSAGRSLRIEGVRQIIEQARPTGAWSELLVDAVMRYRAGVSEDDTLIVEIARPAGG